MAWGPGHLVVHVHFIAGFGFDGAFFWTLLHPNLQPLGLSLAQLWAEGDQNDANKDNQAKQHFGTKGRTL